MYGIKYSIVRTAAVVVIDNNSLVVEGDMAGAAPYVRVYLVS